MKNILLMLTICALFSCKKNSNQELSSRNWRIASSTITPAMTLGSKTSTDFLALMGPSSCEANTELSFSSDGIYTQGSNGALCDMYYDTNSKPVTWTRNNDRITLSSSPDFIFILSGNTLTSTTYITTAGTTYTLVRVYKAK